MVYQECISQVIDYIEANLKDDIKNEKLAKIAGYSEFHFLRIFREVVHLTPADYIRKRRIYEIVRCMETENRPISEIAFEYGFNSKENFVRAFKAEHHILPSEFKTARNSLKLYDRLIFTPSDFPVSVKLQKLEEFSLVVYPCDESFPPNFWNKYNVKQWSKKLSGGAIVEDFGVSLRDDERGKIDYFIGIRKNDAKGDITDTITLNVKAGLYAVFQTPPATIFNFVNTIHRTWEYIYEWLPKNGYARTGDYELESYVEESRLFSEIIYIPIKKSEENYEEFTGEF